MRFPYCPSGTNCVAQRRVPQQVPMGLVRAGGGCPAQGRSETGCCCEKPEASSPIPRILPFTAVVKLRPVSHRGWIFQVRWSWRSMKPGRMIHGILTGESAAPMLCGRASSLGTTRTAPGKSAPSAASRSKSLRGHRAARKRRVHLHIRHVPGRCLHQPSDSVVRSPLK